MSVSRRPTARLVVSPALVADVETARIDAIAATRQSVSKTDAADALIRVACCHMDEVIPMLIKPSEAAEISRLLVPVETTSVVDAALVDAISETRRLVTKTELTNALITVGRRHMDEVAALLKGGDSDE